MAAEDELDPYEARRFFRLPGGSLPEALCRHVLASTLTGVEYSELTTGERAAVFTWATVIGSSMSPSREGWAQLTVRDTVIRKAAREAATLTIELCEAAEVEQLARRLLPSQPDRTPSAVLTAMGTRVYERATRVVDAGDELAVDRDDPFGYRKPRDRYSDLADRTPGTWLIDD